jgi:chromosome segregation ATPase
MQSSFLEKKYKLKQMEEDKESKNLQLRRARGKHDDRQFLLDDAEAEVEKIKTSLAESMTSAARYIEQWTNYSDADSHSEAPPHFNDSNVEDEELHNRVVDLQEQLQCEEKNMKHSQMKLVATELECQRYNRELQDYEDKLKEAIKAQDTTETYMSFIA